MPADSVLLVEPASVPLPASPSFTNASHPISTDSMVSIRLSQPSPPAPPADDAQSTITSSSVDSSSTAESDATIAPTSIHQRRSSVQILTPVDLDTEMNGGADEEFVQDEFAIDDAPVTGSTMPPSPFDDSQDVESHRRDSTGSSSSQQSSDSEQVDWAELEKTEEAAPQDEVSDEQTAFLLARLEQENNALATNPRVANLKKRESTSSKTRAPRPPSIQVLKKMVSDTSSNRYSLLPTPPPMTELEFWAALVKDYPQTAQRLPTLTANKIKGGVPPPLRGVVWVSMVGARDPHLQDEFDRLADEPSPYDVMIGKDIGRSFPGVEMFKEAGGEGQQMLARVLKVFSLYDEEIGYCQGLGFLVGPLLMQMGEKDAFCVLVKLMEKYDLRDCFRPDLNGLHLRIYQFQSLLDAHMPDLAKHFASLAVEAAYLSQWFLSFFAVTCPLPMLFRIYDVIFAEGASETIMRVAMSLMKQNEAKLKTITEFEEVMQLLLGRLLWEPYNGSADDLVNDFVGLTGIVTHESLQKLEKAFKDAKKAGAAPAPRPGFFQDVSMGASRFLGRLWTSHGASKSTASLVPPTNAEGKTGHLRSSPSKQSIAASDVSNHTSSESTSYSVGTTNTDATVMTRDSSGDPLASTSKTDAAANRAKDLHGQIEDLLTALSESQRDHAIMTAQLEKQNEERDEDHRVIQELLTHIKELADLREMQTKTTSKEERRRTTPILPSYGLPTPNQSPASETPEEDLVPELPFTPTPHVLIERAQGRMRTYRDARGSIALETKQRLRQSLLRSKDQLGSEITRATELEHRIHVQTREIDSLRDQLSHARNRIQDDLAERRKLEKQVAGSRPGNFRNSMASIASEGPDSPSIWRVDSWGSKRASIVGGASSPTMSSGGLRELKLGKSLEEQDQARSPASPARSSSGAKSPLSGMKSPGGSSIPARGSSLATRSVLATEDHKPATEDAMLMELVAAKTAEAVAKQELEEVKGRMDALRKMLTLPGATAQNGVELERILGHKSGVSTSSVGQAAAGVDATPKKEDKAKEENLSPPASTTSTWFAWSRRSPSATNMLAAVTPAKK